MAASSAAEMLQRLRSSGTGGSGSAGERKAQRQEGKLSLAGVVNLLVRLVLLHDRSIQDLEDRCSITVLLHAQALKREVVAAREKWQELNPRSKGKKGKKGAGKGKDVDDEDKEMEEIGATAALHPLGCSQRSLLLALVFEQLQKAWEHSKVPEADAVRTALKNLASLEADKLDSFIFRFKPKFRDPVDKYPWAWSVMFSQRAPAEFVEQFMICCTRAVPVPEAPASEAGATCSVRPARSRDGGLSKQLRDFLKGHSGAVREDDDEDDDEDGKKRGRQRR